MRRAFVRLLNPNVNQVISKLRNEAPTYLETVKTANKEKVYKKITDLNNWYTRIIGLDEVKLYQDRVVSLQEKLLEAQETRREIGRTLAETRKKSNHLQDEIHKVKRSEDLEKFLNLMKEETEMLQLENEIARSFQECDKQERELFTAFTNAVRDSHEKQRAQLEYTKYFGIILSIAGSFLAFCFSTLRKGDLKRFIEESVTKSPPVLVPSTTSSNHENSSNNIENTEIFKLVKNETFKLTQIMDHNNKVVAQIIEKEQQEMTRHILICVGATVVFLLVLKSVSGN